MRRLTVLAFTVAACATLSAHDFWLASSDVTPSGNGAQATVTANIGEVFPKGTNYTPPERVEQWRVIGVGGEVPVDRNFQRVADSLVTDVVLPAPGAYLGVMTIAARTIDMKGDEFTDYLKEEGLTQVIEARRAAGETDKGVTERYARYAKIALRHRAGDGSHLTRPVGLRAEFIPRTDPTTLAQGQTLAVQLVAGGKPVAGAEVSAVNASEGAAIKARTDREGVVSFTLPRSGSWLVKTVHMTRVTGEPGVHWESYWVTLAFQTADSAAAPRTAAASGLPSLERQ